VVDARVVSCGCARASSISIASKRSIEYTCHGLPVVPSAILNQAFPIWLMVWCKYGSLAVSRCIRVCSVIFPSSLLMAEAFHFSSCPARSQLLVPWVVKSSSMATGGLTEGVAVECWRCNPSLEIVSVADISSAIFERYLLAL